MIPKELIKQYQKHEITITDIAKKTNLPPNKIYNYFKKIGVKTNYSRTINLKRNLQIIILYDSGYTTIQLGQIFNILSNVYLKLLRTEQNMRINSFEKKQILERAKENLLKNPNISVKSLWQISAQGIDNPNKQVPWFYAEIKKLKVSLIQFPKEQVPKEQVPKEQVPKEQVPKETDLHSLLDNFIQYGRKFEKEFENFKTSLEYANHKLNLLEAKIDSFKGLLQNILGDLTDYHPEEQFKETVKKKQLKIAVIGPLKNQFNEIYNRIENKALLYWFEKDNPINQNQLKGYDYIIISRHCKHSVTWAAQAAIGKEKVYRLPGGINTISDQILEIIKNI